MKSFDKSYIIEKLTELENHLENYIYNRKIDMNSCRKLFTNDFAFFMFNKCLEKLNKSVVPPTIHKVTSKFSNNVFLICKEWLFGVNDDGKIFVLNLHTNSTYLETIYQIFDYEYDILDNYIRKKIKFNENSINLKFSRRTLKVCNAKWIRICGDLRMRVDSSNFVVHHFKDLLALYIYESWMQRLSEHGIIVHTSGTPYTVYVLKRISQLKELVFNELINVLKSINCEIESCRPVYDNPFFPFDAIMINCKFANTKLHVLFCYDSVSKGYNFVVNIDKKEFKKLDFVKNVLNAVGINPKEQDIVLNFGNHKIILHGYYFPLITVGTTFISIDRYFTTKVLLQHPEHHDVEIIFPDLVGIEFDTINIPQTHQMLRNDYFANKMIESNKLVNNN